MAEETLILRLQVLADTKNAKTISELTKRNKELKKVLADAPREGTAEYKKLEKQLEAAKKEFAANKTEVDKFNKELRTGKKEVVAAADSLKGLSATLKSAEAEYKLMTKAQREAAKGKELQNTIRNTRKELLKAEKGLGDYRRQVGNYTRSLVGLNAGFGTVVTSVSGLSSAIKGLPALFRASSVAAKGLILSLGPIAIIVSAIVAAMSRFQGVIDRVQSSIAGLTAGFDVIVERIGRLSSVFTALTSGDFSGALDAVKSAFAGIGDEIAADAAAASDLSNQLQKLRRLQADDLIRLAKIERDVANARRISTELEQTDRAGAADQLQIAIDLLKEKGAIELRNARQTAEIMRQQVDLSTETTSIDDIEKLREAQANVIRVEAGVDNSVRDLIRRRDRLRKEKKETNKEELSQLDQLLKRQGELTKILKNQIATGEDYTSTLQELTTITTRVNEVNAKFAELTENNTAAIDYEVGSIQDYNNQLSELTEQLSKTNIESEEYADIQQQITIVEGKRSVAIGETIKATEELNALLEKQLQDIGTEGTSLKLQEMALAELEALTGTAEEKAIQRLNIEKQLAQDLRDLQRFNLQNELSAIDNELAAVDAAAQKELLLFADNEQKKTQIAAQAEADRNELKKRQIAIEKELLENSKDNFEATEKDKTETEKQQLDKRAELQQLAQDTLTEATKSVTELISTLNENRTEKESAEIDKREDLAIKEAERLNKTEAEKQEIRDKFEEERQKLEKIAAAERKRIALLEAGIDIASAVIKALGTAPAPNIPFAISAGILGAAQLAVIAATQFAGGGLVQPIELSDGKIVNTPNIDAMSNGDNILATVRRGEVILNESQQQRLGGPSTFAKIGVPGFANGGHVTDLSKIPQAKAYATGGFVPTFTNSLQKARAYANGGLASAETANQIEQVLNSNQGVLAKTIAQAVYLASKEGSKEGIQTSNITNQIARENERTEQRNARESV